MTHICVSTLIIIGSDNELSHSRHQAIIWTSAGILIIGTAETNFSESVSEIRAFPLKKMHLKCCLQVVAILSRPQFVKKKHYTQALQASVSISLGKTPAGGCLAEIFWRGVQPGSSQPTEGQNRTIGYEKWVKIKPLTIENVKFVPNLVICFEKKWWNWVKMAKYPNPPPQNFSKFWKRLVI